MIKTTWRTWTSTEADGIGHLEIDQCKPDCARGSYRSLPAGVRATNPTGGPSPLFTVLEVTVQQAKGSVTVSCPLARPTGTGDLMGGCVVPLSRALHLTGPAY